MAASAPKKKAMAAVPAAAAPGGQQPRHAVGGGEQPAGPHGEIRDKAQPQSGSNAGHGPLPVGRAGKEGAQQRPAHRDVQDRQVPQRQCQRRAEKQQSLRGEAVLLTLKKPGKKVGGHTGEQTCRRAGTDAAYRVKGLTGVDSPYGQHHARRQHRHDPRTLEKIRVPKGGGRRDRQDSHGGKGQCLLKGQKQQRPHHAAAQRGGTTCPQSCRRDAPQRKGRVAIHRFAGGQRRGEKKANPPVRHCPERSRAAVRAP